MEGIFFKFLNLLFLVGCTVASIVFVVMLVYEYSLNESVSTLEFTAFHSDVDAVYPSISLCFDFESIYRNESGNDEGRRRRRRRTNEESGRDDQGGNDEIGGNVPIRYEAAQLSG